MEYTAPIAAALWCAALARGLWQVRRRGAGAGAGWVGFVKFALWIQSLSTLFLGLLSLLSLILGLLRGEGLPTGVDRFYASMLAFYAVVLTPFGLLNLYGLVWVNGKTSEAPPPLPPPTPPPIKEVA